MSVFHRAPLSISSEETYGSIAWMTAGSQSCNAKAT